MSDKSWGYPRREDMDNMLDAYIEQKAENRRIAEHLELLLLGMETEEGTYTFPDGTIYPAGVKVLTPGEFLAMSD